MNKLEYGKYKMPTPEDVNAWASEVEEMIKKYGWQDKEVYPYSFPMKLGKIIKDVRGYDRCTRASQVYLLQLANGTVDVLNAWEAYEQAEKVTARIKRNGKIIKICKEDVADWEDLIELI